MFSANVLGLLDPYDASRFLPNLPSLPAQYEPTALGIGTLLLLAVLAIHRFRSQESFGLANSLKEHAALILVLVGLLVLAVTNTVSIGSWSFRIPITWRLEYGLSIFRSSVRMQWPVLIVITVAVATYALRRLRYVALIISLALVIQLVDTTPQIGKVASARDGRSVSIPFDQAFWSRVPERYTTIASLPADNYGFDWSPCTLAAVRTGRSAECGWFGRLQGLETVNSSRLSQVLTGDLESDVIYMVSMRWLINYERELASTISNRQISAVAAVGVTGFTPSTVFLFPQCASKSACDFVGDLYRPLDAAFFDEWRE